MNITGKTILITGGGSGIGFEIAKQLIKDNRLIITGRNRQKLDDALGKLSNTVAIEADLTIESDVNHLVQQIEKEYNDLSILINNAGCVYFYTLSENADAFKKSQEEFSINYFAPVRLTEKLLPLLKKQQEAAIINVSSLLGLSPMVIVPTYSDSKAALHSYTQSLRHSLAKETNIKVFELIPPLVSTELFAQAGGKENGISASVVAQDLLKAVNEDKFEIPVGQAEQLYTGFFSGSAKAFSIINQNF